MKHPMEACRNPLNENKELMRDIQQLREQLASEKDWCQHLRIQLAAEVEKVNKLNAALTAEREQFRSALKDLRGQNESEDVRLLIELLQKARKCMESLAPNLVSEIDAALLEVRKQ
jgi:hypothetical protein